MLLRRYKWRERPNLPEKERITVMKKGAVKAGIVGALIATAIFCGIELASSGIDRVYGSYENAGQPPGPVPAPATATVPPAADGTSVQSEGELAANQQALPSSTAVQPRQPAPEKLTLVNRFAIKLGEALRWGAQQTIKLTVSLFKGLL